MIKLAKIDKEPMFPFRNLKREKRLTERQKYSVMVNAENFVKRRRR